MVNIQSKVYTIMIFDLKMPKKLVLLYFTFKIKRIYDFFGCILD